MEKLTILHSIYSYLPVTQNWIYSQIHFNKRCTHAVVSITEEQTSQFPLNNRYTVFRPHHGAADRIRLLMARYWFRQPELFFRDVLEKTAPDLIHGHFSTESWRVLRQAHAAGIPMVTTFYGLDVDKLARRRFWKRRYPQLFEYSSFVMAEGPFMGKRIEAAGCPADKIAVIALGVDLSRYPRRREESKCDKSRAVVKVLFVGLNREKKGAPDAATVFTAACKENPYIELHIVGNGRYRSAVERILRKGGVLNRTVFHGALSFERYCRILAETDILLVPSCYAADGDCEGGAPVVCIEAQVMSIPVIGTRHCDIPFVVRHGESGFLADEHDTAAMTRGLLLLASDEKLRKSMGAKGRKHAQQQHDIHRQVELITRIYRRAVEQHRKRSGNG